MRTRIRFVPPGWFAVDVPVVARLDDETLYEGSFLAGFSKEFELAPGSYSLDATIKTLLARRRSWTFEVPEDDDGSVLVVELGYSRTWGGFERDLKIRRVDASEADDDAAPVEEEEPPPRQRVVATWGLLAALLLGFIAELALGVGPSFELSPSVETLTALGALAPPDAADGVWFRALSCTFLHGSGFHLLMNAVALFMAGMVVESIVGWRWFLALYFVGALGGSGLSLAFNDGTMVSVGASGAIMGIFAAGLFIAQTLPSATRGPVQFQLLRVLVPSLLPIIPQVGDARIDFGAHLGGALAGVIAGALLLRALRRRPADDDGLIRSPIATVLSGVFLLASVGALVGVALVAYPAGRAYAAVAAGLVPDDQIVGQERPDALLVERWLDDYPDDPRVRLLAAENAAARESWEEVATHVAHGMEVVARYSGIFTDAGLSDMEQQFRALEAEGAVRRELLPNRLNPTGSPAEKAAAWTRHLDEWLERYPNDPRVRNEAAFRALGAGDYQAAERHAGHGLAQVPRFASVFPDGLSADVASMMGTRAVAFLELGRGEEAAPILAVLCAGEHGESAQAYFTERGLCEGDTSPTPPGVERP